MVKAYSWVGRRNSSLRNRLPFYQTPIIVSEERRCVSAFAPNENVKGKDIVLGSGFLRAFNGVFDLDERTVSCEYPSIF
jgi:hypothetical protein